ncbi:G1/S-specific cyclin cln3, partial [Cichlidogyrus casuarinus]
NTVSTYASGTGGAGVFGALYYAWMASVLPPDTIIQITSIVPISCFLIYLILLPKGRATSFSWNFLAHCRKQNSPRLHEDEAQPLVVDVVETDEQLTETVDQVEPSAMVKLQLIKQVAHLMAALCLVYYFEYLINQALFEFMYFPGNSLNLDLAAQYRWYQVLYQVGVFISRSSVNLFHVRQTWILTLLQGVNFFLLLGHVLQPFLPALWLAFALVLYEGLLGGLSYVNTFYRISKESPPKYREFILATASTADGFGIMLSAFSAILVHNALCDRIKSGQ